MSTCHYCGTKDSLDKSWRCNKCGGEQPESARPKPWWDYEPTEEQKRLDAETDKRWAREADARKARKLFGKIVLVSALVLFGTVLCVVVAGALLAVLAAPTG